MPRTVLLMGGLDWKEVALRMLLFTCAFAALDSLVSIIFYVAL